MDGILLFGLIFMTVSCGTLLWLYISTRRNIKNEIEEFKKLNYEQIYAENKRKIDAEFESKKRELSELRGQIDRVQEINNNLRMVREEDLDRYITQKKERQLLLISQQVDDWAKSAQEAAKFNTLRYEREANEKKIELKQLMDEIEDFRARRNAINEQIKHAREIEEQKDFYRIQIEEAALKDMAIFNSIRQYLSNTSILDKLIYNACIDKPVKEMIARIFNGKNPSGIYKVTLIETGESYIGKSKTCATRWQNHIKTVYGLESVANSSFQRALKKYGVEAFTWELLEEVAPENLTEREIYYIKLYDTKNFGFNERVG